MLLLVALADDLTGALEVGALFGAAVSTRAALEADLPALVIDTETRHLDARRAAEIVGRLARESRERGARLVYKKTDSTLRGNIAAELAALAEAWPGRGIVYAPAYPGMGRTVRGGRLLVEGVPVERTAFARDPLDPVRESHVPTLLAAGGAAGIEVADGETDDDVRRVARRLMDGGAPLLAAGPGALAGELARLAGLGCPGPPPALGKALVVNGSRHEVSARQVEYARRHGLEEAGWRVLDEAGTQLTGMERAVFTGQRVRGILEREALDTLVIFGGDTAYGVLRALGEPLLYPLGEALPGVPVSRAAFAGRTLHLVTKAGGFGPPGLLARLVRMS